MKGGFKKSLLGLAALGFSFSALAINDSQHLGSHGQSKVESAQARGWMTQGNTKSSGYDVQQSQQMVNIGSKRAGTCNMNVGGTSSGRGNKDVVVTAKDIINVCK